MNLKQARYICAIAREGGVTAAAKKLYISQPSLSQMLRQVEGELGVPLFERSVSPFQLTFAGEKYIQAAETMLRTNQRLEDEIQEIKRENSGRLRLGISVQRAMQLLPLLLPEFSARFPRVTLEITERGSAHLEELVFQGRVDLALAAMESISPRLTYQLIEREVVGILAGEGSGLARQYPDGAPITLELAGGESFVCLKEGHSIRVVQDDLFRRRGLTPKILLETDSMEVARRVALGTGSCMLCPHIFADGPGRFYPLRDYENSRHFYACYPKNAPLPKYSAELLQIVSRILEQLEVKRPRCPSPPGREPQGS